MPFRVVVAALVPREGRLLLCRRPPGTHLEGLWEFPGGGVEEGESPPEALVRELREELGVAAEVGEPFTFVYHEYSDRSVLLLFYWAAVSGEPAGVEGQQVGWFRPAELAGLALPPADERVVALLTRTAVFPRE